ncbi:hypothetical protein ACFXPX_38510 [Kitasatospora sp. NPDC059146]|uniref:hypothetical protein n=1 Tax=unclassified Kitasatospora TaxID=2633591 RepID=UPI00369B75FC
MSTTTTTLAYRIGAPNNQCRRPVIIGAEEEPRLLGYVSRWHRDWLAEDNNGQVHNVRRPAVGSKGQDKAADWLANEFVNGRIQAVPLTDTVAEVPSPYGPAPLLHPRMDEKRNRDSALAAIARVTEFHWTPLSGYPGSDNLWLLRCDLCGAVVMKHYSHLRGRNGNPPSANRHPGCKSEAEVRQLIAAYQQ